MASVGAASSTVLWLSSASRSQNANHRICILSGNQNHSKALSFSTLCTSHVPLPQNNGLWSSIDFSLKAASSSFSVDNVDYIEEPATKVRFQRLLSLPGRSTSLSLVGTGYREKVFAIIGVKVYAAGLYINESIFSLLHAWKERSAADLKRDSSLFDTIFQAPTEKSLHIVLVRDVDGKTFWDALNDAISPRITSRTPVDEDALSTFANIFLGRPLNKGTFIFMIWLDSTNMLVSVSSEGMPVDVGTKIESSNVTAALFDVFLGGESVSPTLKESVANGLAAVLK